MRKVIYCCDRCKKEYKYSKMEEENRNLKLLDFQEDNYDICPDCYVDLERWFDEGFIPDGDRTS